ncbi:50S ribosomal protein L25 [Actinomarinicola tropica]|uniref:Large ribosomal subunit protein bL25 n=1 Tax=Actinomarinicola tropica TaxID=2789776 RepID=A0A5Q2RNK7_9ACTN|nr:50S ribosomal protein L25 [Actinomarinicola tropica]QGG96006.1 50S ribosomal protein L25 [Actinomarinicola tropica]
MDVTLTANVGRTTGSRPSNRLRDEGQIPGVLYGLGGDAITLAVDRRELRQALTTDAGLNAIITLDVDGSDELCIVRELQRHPIRNDVVHVDFIRVDPNAEILVEVPLVLEGEAKQVLAEQGVVDQVHYTLSVYAKPSAIPNELVIDVSEMAVGDTITVADLTLPSGARTEAEPDEVLVTASVTRAALEEEGEEAAEGEEGAEGEAAEGGDAEDAGGEAAEASDES